MTDDSGTRYDQKNEEKFTLLFEITLNEDQFNQLKALLEKLGGLNLDLGSLKSQAQAAYDTLKNMGFDTSKIHIDTEEAKGIFQQIIDMIKGWFN